MRRTGRPAATRGFTLIELVLAAFIALLVIAGIYLVYQGHERIFVGQRLVSEAQSNLRFATEQVRADLARTGYMGVRNTKAPATRQHLCGPPDIGDISAVKIYQAPDPLAGWRHMPAVNTVAAPDTLDLVGNFIDSTTYWVDRRIGQNITLQNTTTADPNDPYPPCQAEFNRIFVSDLNAVRVVTNGQKVHISRLVGANYATGLVQTATALPTDCEPSLCNLCELSLLQRIRYRVGQAAAEGVLTAAELNILATPVPNLVPFVNARPVLLREFLSWSDGSVLRTEVVAENVFDFQIWFLFDDITEPEALRPAVDQSPHAMSEPTWFTFDDTRYGGVGGGPCGGSAIGDDANCAAENVVAARFRISVRTSREDEAFHLRRSDPRDHFRFYQIVDEPGEPDNAARIRTLVGQVDMPNIRFGL